MRILGKDFFNVKEVYVRWIGIPILAYIMALVYPTELDRTLLDRYITALVLTTVYWNGSVMIFMYFRRKFPEIHQTPKRLTITFLALICFMIISDPVMFTLLDIRPIGTAFSLKHVMLDSTFNIITALVIGSVYENVYFFELWKKSTWLNDALRNQQIRTQFEVLQNQMSPHFLFNSLNTLTTLISEDRPLAIEFTEKLSEVYRYILQNKEREVVRLKEELDFTMNYVFLLRIRYSENLNVTFDVGEEYMDMSIAPLTIQILLENAIKHNAISKASPLHVYTFVQNSSIVVRNNLQKRNVVGNSTKTGLTNIINRYAYLGQKSIEINVTPGEFAVSVPLLQIKNGVVQLMEPVS